MKRLLPLDSQGPGFSTGSGNTFTRLSRRLRDKDQPKAAVSDVDAVAPEDGDTDDDASPPEE